MRKILFVILFIFITGCAENETSSTNDSIIWQPKPSSIINDGQILIKWFNPIVYEKTLLPYEIVEPDKFEIYQSYETISAFRRLVEIENDGMYEFLIDNLENDKSYYFYIVSKKKGYPSSPSDIIMVIPNPKSESENIITLENSHTIVSATFAPGINKIAYVDLYYQWDSGVNCCMAASILISNINGSDSELVETSTYEPYWSPTNDKIVFRTENGEINLGNGIPSQIAIFDFNTKIITKLTNDTVFNYAPVFSKNGKMILFQSSKNVPEIYATNIWFMDIETLENYQITDVSNSALLDAGRPNWIDNEYFLFQATNSDNKSDIYRSSISTKAINLIIESRWNDYCPSISPDGIHIAFVSDRSGNYRIWLYNLDTQSYKQLTGYSDNDYLDATWSRIEWVDNSNILYTFEGNRLIKQRIE